MARQRRFVSIYNMVRDQAEKYTSTQAKEHGAEVWNGLRMVHTSICGDKTYMAKDVHRALIEIAMEHGGG